MKETFQEQLAKQIGFVGRNKPPVMADVLIQGRVETMSLNGCANIDEYNHYADFMNAAIQAAGGSMSIQESNACTLTYNRLFGRSVHLLPETEQNPGHSGDKKNEGNNTTHQPKLEDIHMSNEHTADIGTPKAANSSRIAHVDAELAAARGQAGPADPLERTALLMAASEDSLHHIRSDIHNLAAKLAAKKTPVDHSLEVAKVAGGVFLGISAWIAVKAGVEYLFFKPIG